MLSGDLLPALFLVEGEALLLEVFNGDIGGIGFYQYLEKGIDEFVIDFHVFGEEVEAVDKVLADAFEEQF